MIKWTADSKKRNWTFYKKSSHAVNDKNCGDKELKEILYLKVFY